MSARFDEENVLRMLQEDDAMQRRAFGMIVEEYGKPLYWQIRRLVLDHDDANDVLQETLIQAWNNIDYFRGESKLSTWLYRIAINQSLNFLNKQKAQQSISMDDEEVSVANQLEGDHVHDLEVQFRFFRFVSVVHADLPPFVLGKVKVMLSDVVQHGRRDHLPAGVDPLRFHISAFLISKLTCTFFSSSGYS